MKIKMTVDEFLVGTRIVEYGEKDGIVYAVAVMPRDEAVVILDRNIQMQIDKTLSNIEKARKGDKESFGKAREEYLKAVAFSKERDLMEGVKRSSSRAMKELEDEIITPQHAD